MQTYLGGFRVISDLLSLVECQQLIQACESQSFEAASVQSARGEIIATSVRNNDRMVIDDPKLLNQLFMKVQQFFTAAVGLNPRLRVYRYKFGQQFDWHVDDFYATSSEESKQTFLLYLNDDYEGGSTDFTWESFRVKAGSALIFPHHLRHRGAPITSGIKYVLRTDLMYKIE